ncbi:zonular occludens toxin domain-containing protein [Pseudomonas sp. Z8(2022)]|uniref:zonular occludens toxin domain-containing protein n=1 Tax=Pseudomonas sp. Z8(2022) TaxID=2962597 RepID=UPI0021F46B0D|nr:zonular occludens toxin domain-containing protein [Pseudomonas sp. Z8(2022)]UYP28533.1 zonular occludens toxin domain-containing protein [Pseudomonas sp. Z8(2022)]UYP28543.1 zonular occludens toxin domain-containing protein [Pseudomonas sp. Z8(2022)]UYP32493.1 zonular occludens toxin domain-containing protein [Pseudomonas sp. Z8(2022)]
MFVLRTGLQGNGKTLNTIKEVDLKAAKEGRQVYYHNIRGFNPGAEVLQAAWEEFDDPLKWHLLPQNAMIVIDEAQTFFRVRKAGSAVPDYASALETMRHRGHELHCITQNPGLLDSHFRKLCNSHIHYVRGHKGKVVKRWEFERVNPEVEKRNNFTDGQATRILLDKKYFGVYQSVAEGSEHHMKFKPPRALFVLGAALLVVAVLGYRVYQSRIATPDDAGAPVAEQGAGSFIPSLPAPVADGSLQPLTVEEYVDLRVPRLPDVPSSAPIYDELTRPVTYPKLSCVNSSNSEMVARNHKRMVMGYRDGKVYGCRCNTQQGTRYDVSFEACMAYVENGAFDHAKPDRDQLQAVAGTGTGDAGAGTGTAMAGYHSRPVEPVRVTVIPDSSRQPRKTL